MAVYPYRESKQLQQYIGQFMRVFAGFQVPTGRDTNGITGLKRIPVVYGTMDRVVASILNKRETFTNKRIPIMAVNMTGMTRDVQNKLPKQHVEYVHHGSLVAGDRQGFVRLMGVPLVLDMELTIYADSNNQLLEIVEQLLLIFNPRVTIQVDEQAVNSDYITEIILESIASDIQYPIGTEKRVVSLTMNFSVPVRLRYPVDTNDNYIDMIRQQIFDKTAAEFIELEPLVTENIGNE